MLKVIFKYFIQYTFFRKYGKRLALILSIISFIILVNFIYSDMVEYLTLNNMKESLIYALLIKWLLVLICIGLIIYIINLSITNKEHQVANKEVKTNKESIKKPISSIEQEIMNKDELKPRGDKIIEEMKKRKKDA